MLYALAMVFLPCNDVHALLVRKGRHRSRYIRLSCTGMALGCPWCGCECGLPTLLRTPNNRTPGAQMFAFLWCCALRLPRVMVCCVMAHRLDIATLGTWYPQSAVWHRVNGVGGHQLALGEERFDSSWLGCINTLSLR